MKTLLYVAIKFNFPKQLIYKNGTMREVNSWL